MLGKDCFETISAGAISKVMPTCKGIIINVGEQKHIIENLYDMFFNADCKFFVTNCSLEKLPKVLKRCYNLGVPAIVNCGKNMIDRELIAIEGKYNATCVIPKSYDAKNNIVQKILDDNNIVNASFLAFQGYYFSPDNLLTINNKYFEQMRLGQLRDNISLCEPLLRDSEYFFVDFNSVRYSDFPCNVYSNPNGLYAEEMCQIARYIGFGQKLKAIFLFGEPSLEDNSLISNILTAQVIWHICNGLITNSIENPASNSKNTNFLKKIVQLDDNGENITFINSLLTDRWWMEIPSNSSNKSILIPCSIDDYKTACKGEIPLRWLFFYQKHTIL